MEIIHALMLVVLITACAFFSYTDLKENRISNQALMVFYLIGLVLDVTYYVFFDSDVFFVFITNVVLITVISIVLYATHVWAGGDSKLLLLISLLIPTELTFTNNGPFYEFMIPVYAFSAGFLFLLGDTLNQIAHKRLHIAKQSFFFKCQQYVIQTAINSIYILTLLKIEDFLLRKFQLQLGYWEAVINICALILISHFAFFSKWEVIMLTSLGSILYSIGTGIWMLNIYRLFYYILIAGFMLLQILIGEFNYKEIPTESVRPGMVLSFFTTLSFRGSRINGLPSVSTEDMKSRITESEATAIQKWQQSKNGKRTITIVRKIPFAIFISLGTAIYLVATSMLRR